MRGHPREVSDEQQRIMRPPLRHVDPGEAQLLRLHREPRDHVGSGLKRGERDANARAVRLDAAVAGISRHTSILDAAAGADNRAITLVFPQSDPEISWGGDEQESRLRAADCWCWIVAAATLLALSAP